LALAFLLRALDLVALHALAAFLFLLFEELAAEDVGAHAGGGALRGGGHGGGLGMLQDADGWLALAAVAAATVRSDASVGHDVGWTRSLLLVHAFVWYAWSVV
jgi:hypothetical protein